VRRQLRRQVITHYVWRVEGFDFLVHTHDTSQIFSPKARSLFDEREGKKRVVRCARGRRAHAHRRARRRPPSRRSRSCAAGREGARRARARSVVARGNSPRNIVSSQEKPSSVITRASCVRSPSRPECGLAPPEYERATRRARVPSERCPCRAETRGKSSLKKRPESVKNGTHHNLSR
jgi:hypothetical protein